MNFNFERANSGTNASKNREEKASRNSRDKYEKE